MINVSLVGSDNISAIYARLRKIDSIIDEKINSSISQEELDKARKEGINLTVEFKEGKTSSLDALQRVYLKLQKLDKQDGTQDGNIKELKEHLGILFSPEQLGKIVVSLEIQGIDTSSQDKTAREIALDLVKNNARSFDNIDRSFKNDKEIILAAVKSCRKSYLNEWAILDQVDTSLRKDREFMLELIKQDSSALGIADISLKRDKAFILAAIKQDGEAGEGLYYADSSLKKNREFMLLAINFSGKALKYADKSLKKDKKFVLSAVKIDGWSLEYVAESLSKDKDVVLAAAKQSGWAIQYADMSLIDNKEIAIAADKQIGWAVQYENESFKRDNDIALQSAKQLLLEIKQLDIAILLKDYEKYVNLLINTFRAVTEEQNPWVSHPEKYYFPLFEAANIIGDIALQARRTNNTNAIDYINGSARPLIERLLGFRSTEHDYEFVYVIYPMKKSLLEALIKIGNPDSIPAIKRCDNNDYISSYNWRDVSIREFKDEAINYLEKQNQCNNFLDPFSAK